MRRDVGRERPSFNDFVAASLRTEAPYRDMSRMANLAADAVLFLDLPSDASQFVASGPLRNMVEAAMAFQGKDWFDRLRIVSEGRPYSSKEFSGIAARMGIAGGD